MESPLAPSICQKPIFPHCSDLLLVTPSIHGVTVVRSFRVRALCCLSVPLLALVMLSRVKLHCRAGIIVAIINNNGSGRRSEFYFYPPLQSCAAGVISSMVERTYYNCGSGVKQLAQVHVASGRALDWNFNTLPSNSARLCNFTPPLSLCTYFLFSLPGSCPACSAQWRKLPDLS